MHATVHRFLLCVLILGLASEAVAQPGRGFGGRDRGTMRAMQLLEPDSFLGASLFPSFPGSPSAAAMEALQLTEEQRTQLQAVREKLSETLRELPEDATDDDRKAKLKPFEADALKVLTPEQRGTWDKGKAEYAQKVTEMRQRFQEGGFGPRPGGAPPTGPGAPPSAPREPAPPRMALPNTPPPEGEQVAASFGATGGPAPRTREPRMSFNFRYAPWAEVLKLFAEAAGLTLDLNDSPAGTFNYYDDQEYTATEALDVLNGYLLPKGYILLRRDRFLVCVTIDEGIPPNLIPSITVEELGQRGKNEMVSLVIPLAEGIEADKIVGEVRELLGPQGKASALKNTNSIVVSDIGVNVRRIYALVKAGTAVDNRETAFRSIPLKHISANDAERMVRRLFGLNPTTTSTTSTPQMQFSPWGGGPWGGGPPPMGRDGRPDFSQMQQPQQSSSSSSRSSGTPSPYVGKIMVSADTRTNHLLVTASSSLLKVVEEMVLAMDTNADASGKPIVASDSPIRLKVYSVTGAEVAQVARTLSMLMPGLAIIDDARSAKLHIQATDAEHKEVEELLRSLTGDGANSVAVIPLTRLDPIAATNTLRNLFINDGSRAPTIEADALGRRLMVRGTPDQVAQVRALLTQLGEGGNTEQSVEATGRGPVRTFPLGGRDPEEFLPLLRQVWATQTKNPIRVVVPSQPNPIQDRKVPSRGGSPFPGSAPEMRPQPLQPGAVDDRSTRRPTTPTIQRASLQQPAEEPAPQPPARKLTNTLPDEDPLDRFLKSFLDDEAKPAEGAMPAEGDDPAPATAENGQMPIGISIIGDEMIITSKDEAALDQFELLMDNLAMSIPARTRWTVFYLRTADATETAQMLERLFPQSTVTTSTQSTDGLLGSFAGGMSSLGRGMMNVTGLNQTLGGQSLRIVTDIRANALFVTGPGDKIQEIEQMLQLLDSAELPESLRDRLPRSIPVEYADIDEVADVVESVFKDSMQGEQGGGGQQGRNFNPLQMLMAQGGGGGQGGGRAARGPELTLGVDSRTSHLIVSCNDALFRRIEELVKTIDQRAKDARQTVRVVPLATADPTLVSSTLSSLIPKVTVSGTRSSTRRSRTQEQPAQPGGGGGQERSQPEAVRDPEVIRRMMESQMQQNRGGESRNPFGGAPGGGNPFGGRGGNPFGGRGGNN